jgi:peptidoglycan-associated lipoprotein
MKRVALFAVVVLVAGALISAACQQKKPARPAARTPGLQRIHFDFDRSNIKSEYEQTLADNADWMRSHPNTQVTVEGHCDERGSIEYNIALGDRRANSAKAYLENIGIDPTRLSTISYGKERPLCTESNEACWWQNRRDEFVAH